MSCSNGGWNARGKPGKEGPEVDISIIVVTWNAKKFVEECFGSIREETRGLSTETVVVDNASTDGTADLIAERFPEVKLNRSPKNLWLPGRKRCRHCGEPAVEIRLSGES